MILGNISSRELCDFIKLSYFEITKEKQKQQLNQRRQEFSTLLYNMNEYAQENIPPRTLVKNIKFGE